MSTERSSGPKPPVPCLSLHHLLEHQASRIPDAPAILALGRPPLTYGRLYQHIRETERALRAMGIGRHDRIAVVLPNGPELAVAILSVATSAACAPVNPAFGNEELEEYFANLRPQAVLTQAGIDSPARRAALSRGIRVIELSTASDADAGLFTLTGADGVAHFDEPVSAGHTAVLLPTSGTTARPKIVPQTQANICNSAYATAAALALSETDRCLNIMPLFHGHGLTATVVASLAAGASVVCTPGLDVNRFPEWLTTFEASWFTAVPTMHQAILAYARHSGVRLSDRRLRLVRSSSASLAPRIFAELERAFEAPVIEWYGMTEVTSSPIACNPLPPRQRKAGSVGVPVALDVAIMDERGTLLPNGQTGQVVVRGASVTTGYDRNPRATEAAFAGDWLKTGDVGYFDDDGYLFLVGRIREMINRGGEKIAPQEVDEVLLDHPAVAEAATFAVPHATLGEDVASAIVLRPDAAATPKDIRQFALGRIADFKVPRQVLIVKQIPKGPTGKVQRVGLAAKLGLENHASATQAYVAPRTPIEKALAGIWGEVLQVEQIGAHDDFFALGGDSLLATRVLIRLHEIMHVEVEFSLFFEAPTLAEMAHHIETLSATAHPRQTAATITRVPRENGMAPASIAQERISELLSVVPDLPFFNVVLPLRLTAPCDPAVLERSINEVVRRHEILRTTFAIVEGRHVQVIAPQLTVPLAFEDLQGLDGSSRQTVVQQLLRTELLHSFDLARGPLIRVRLVRLAEHTHLLLIAVAGVIEDGWSLGVLVDELATLYDAFAAGRPSPLAPLPIQYADFADWQRRWRSCPDMVAQLAYWEEQLHEPLPAIELANGGRRRTIDDFCPARRQVAMPARLSEVAKDFSRREGVTLFMTLAAAFKTMLHRYTGADDLRVATHVANRNRPGTEGLIGPLVNTVILRTSLAGDPSAREVIRRVRATTLGALANQDIPLEAVVEALEHNRGVEPAALAQVMLWLQGPPLQSKAEDPGFAFEEVDPGMLLPLVTMTAFDVILMLREMPQGLVGTCVYKPHFSTATIERLLRDFQQVLEQMVMQPERSISVIAVSKKTEVEPLNTELASD